MADQKPLTHEQRILLAQYYQARVAWESGDDANFHRDGQIYASALQACIDAGFDPFHYPTPL